MPKDKQDAIHDLKQDIYQVVLRYSEPREGHDFSGNGHHFAQKVSTLIGELYAERLSQSPQDKNRAFENLTSYVESVNRQAQEYAEFYEKNISWVTQACRDRYKSEWQPLARQWGETDDQGIHKQFYFFVGKLEYHLELPVSDSTA